MKKLTLKFLPLMFFASVSFAAAVPVQFTFHNFPVGTALSFNYDHMRGNAGVIINSDADNLYSYLNLFVTRAVEIGKGSVQITSLNPELNCNVHLIDSSDDKGTYEGYANGTPECKNLHFSAVKLTDSGMQIDVSYL